MDDLQRKRPDINEQAETLVSKLNELFREGDIEGVKFLLRRPLDREDIVEDALDDPALIQEILPLANEVESARLDGPKGIYKEVLKGRRNGREFASQQGAHPESGTPLPTPAAPPVVLSNVISLTSRLARTTLSQ